MSLVLENVGSNCFVFDGLSGELHGMSQSTNVFLCSFVSSPPVFYGISDSKFSEFADKQSSLLSSRSESSLVLLVPSMKRLKMKSSLPNWRCMVTMLFFQSRKSFLSFR